MDLASIAQILNPFLQTVFIVVIGLGYYYTTKAIRSQVDEMARQATTGGRQPLVVGRPQGDAGPSRPEPRRMAHRKARSPRARGYRPERTEGYHNRQRRRCQTPRAVTSSPGRRSPAGEEGYGEINKYPSPLHVCLCECRGMLAMLTLIEETGNGSQ